MADQEPEIITGRPEELAEQRNQAVSHDAGRKRLREIYDRALSVLKAGLSEDLQQELEAFATPLPATASESEIRIAQAQLLGWLEGLFQGIQAALWAQQMEARAQLDGMRRGLPPGPGGRIERPSPGYL